MDVRSRGRTATVALAGALDLDATGRVEKVYEGLCTRPDVEEIVLDLRQLELIDSSGIAMVLHLYGDSQRAGRRLVIVRPQPVVLHRFDAIGATEHLEMVDAPD
jgi:anti-anti-sigma factor